MFKYYRVLYRQRHAWEAAAFQAEHRVGVVALSPGVEALLPAAVREQLGD